MASGNEHVTDSIVLAPIAGGLVYLAGDQTPEALFTGLVLASGVLSGILLTPDLDSDGPIAATNIAVIGTIWRVLWWPYSQIFPHRSAWTHAPGLSTMIRLAYLTVLVMLGTLLLGGDIGETIEWISLHRNLLSIWITGLLISDTAHFIRDYSDVARRVSFGILLLGVIILLLTGIP